jgi:hypothetical protein
MLGRVELLRVVVARLPEQDPVALGVDGGPEFAARRVDDDLGRG